MWQRMLFTVFGVDLVSITIIVSVFMFGLGLGGWLGGRLADRMPQHLLSLYVLIEILIAIFGFMSPDLIENAGNTFLTNNEFVTAAVCYVILSVPTLLMGATFPILVVHVNRSLKNIGESVGVLYFANTVGAAFGAYLAGFVLLFYIDAAGVVACAAALNLFTAAVAWLVFRREIA
jgi:predicted membrane-bound spermidine synthase